MSLGALARESRIIKRYNLTREFYDEQIAAGNLWCSTCKRFKPGSEIAGRINRTKCKECVRIQGRKDYAKHKVRDNARRLLYAKQNPMAEAERDRKAHLAERGLDGAWYQRTLNKQGGTCALCGGHQNHAKQKNLCIDHCHTTGKIRGLLCSRCNLRLGQLEQYPGWFERARAYLKKHGTPLPSPKLRGL